MWPFCLHLGHCASLNLHSSGVCPFRAHLKHGFRYCILFCLGWTLCIAAPSLYYPSSAASFEAVRFLSDNNRFCVLWPHTTSTSLSRRESPKLSPNSQYSDLCNILRDCFAFLLVSLVELKPFYNHERLRRYMFAAYLSQLRECLRLSNKLVAGLAGAHRSLNKLNVLAPIRLSKAGTCFASGTSFARKYCSKRS